MTPAHVNRQAQLREVARQLDAAGHGQRGSIVEREAAALGLSRDALYRALKREVGWSSARKPRVDKGTSAMGTEPLQTVAAMLKVSVRQNGKRQLPSTVACSIAAQNGVALPVSTSQVNRLLRQRGLDVGRQQQASPHTALRSLHPNHVHQVDPSLCAVYYLRGKQHIMEAGEFYKNKLDKIAKLQFKVYRYVLTDHCSGVVIVWYVEAAGESQANLFEFLLFAWGEKPDFPFLGVCLLLLLDKGSANSAHGIRNLCKSLGVDILTHAPGNARAKGSVENGNNLVETQFESRLRFEPVQTVAELNAAAMCWMRGYNANLLPNQDTQLRRGGRIVGSRLDLWLRISAEQLRLLPSRAVCAALVRGASVTRQVRGDMSISYRHPQAEGSRSYRLEGCPGINRGDTVQVSPLVYGGDCAVAVSIARYDGQTLEYRIAPEAPADDFGFAATAATIGEAFKRPHKTELETVGDTLDRLAFGDKPLADIASDKQKHVTPFAHSGGLDAHGHLQQLDLPAYLQKRGQAIEVGGPKLESPRLEVNAALLRLRKVLGHAFDPAIRGWIETRFADGIPEDQLDTLARDWRERASTPQALPGAGLRLVGGAS